MRDRVCDLSPRDLLSLPLGARGRLVLEEATILFQVVALPDLARPRLPASLRSSALTLVDRSFATVLAASFVLHLAMVLALKRVEWPRGAEESIVESQRGFLRKSQPPPKQPKDAAGADADARPRHASKRSPALPAKPSTRPPADDRRALVEKVGRVGLLAVLTAKREEGSGVLPDLLGAGNVERSQEAALAEVRGVDLASADTRPALVWSHGSGTIVDVRGIANPGSRIAVAHTGAGSERRVPTVRADAPILESEAEGQLDEKVLVREVRGRLGAVRACYERGLKRNPNLAGKMLLHISISAAGTVNSVDVVSDSVEDQEMTACMRGLILHWRFPGSSMSRVEMSLPFVFQSAS